MQPAFSEKHLAYMALNSCALMVLREGRFKPGQQTDTPFAAVGQRAQSLMTFSEMRDARLPSPGAPHAPSPNPSPTPYFPGPCPSVSPQQLGAQLKHQFGPALAAADAMIRQQQEESRATGGGGSGSGSPTPKATIARMNPKRTGVLLDFGAGTSFASFAELWDYLRHNGWAILPGKGLASWYYFPPGSDPRMPHPVLWQDYFDSEDAVIDHVRRTGLERPAPVGAAVSEVFVCFLVLFLDFLPFGFVSFVCFLSLVAPF